MKVEDRLPGAAAIVENRAVAVFEFALLGELRGAQFDQQGGDRDVGTEFLTGLMV